jgi:hypothetical protein
MLSDDTLCTGTTHPSCAACARRSWPLVVDRGQFLNERRSHIAPPINPSTGYCPESKAR